MPDVIVINARTKRQTDKLPVAAYCRVSSNSDDQRNSFASQVKEYTTQINVNDEWALAGIYADEGISGTSAKKRPEFNRLMDDCRQGKVKRVLVKSISRFARNTLECLEYIRELKMLGVSVYFEKENLDIATLSSEMLIAMLGSMAQEESTSISQNMCWSYEKRMKSGEFITNTAPYGYRLIGGKLVICDEEAETVRRIFREYLNGQSTEMIAQQLNGERADSNKTVWLPTTIKRILANEKYIGDAHLRKEPYYGPDLLKKAHQQEDRAQYYVQNSHEPIIEREIFNKAQMLSNKRRTSNSEPEDAALRKIIRCAECGSVFRRRVAKNGRISWTCYKHDRDKNACPTPPVDELNILQAFLNMFFILKYNYNSILQPLILQLQHLQDKSVIGNDDINTLNNKITDLADQIHAINRLKSKGFLEPDAFQEKTNELNSQLKDAQDKRSRLIRNEIEDDALVKTEELIDILQTAPDNLASLDDGEVFSMMVDKVIIDKNKRIIFRLINGLELVGDEGGNGED